MPPLFNAISTVLLVCATPTALFCFVMAGFQLREEGGVNYNSSGGFFKWILWGAVFLTLTGIMAWLKAELPDVTFPGSSGYAPDYTWNVQAAWTHFVFDILRDRIVPIVAGALVLKALLDTGEGRSPFPSIISALFLLGVGGFFTQAQGWNDNSQYATANLLKNMLNWAMNSVAPVLGAMAIYGAIVQFVRKQEWVMYVIVGASLLVVPAIWALIQKWAGVSL